MTIHVKFGNKTVIPFPSADGQFSDVTTPNCPATSCCLIRAAIALGVSHPELTDAELATARAAILADKANWLDALGEAVTFSATAEEIQKHIDSVRGYTDEELADYIEKNTVFVKDEDGNDTDEVDSAPSEADAVAVLIAETYTVGVGSTAPVVVPTETEAESAIIEAKEAEEVETRLQALIESGHLVTDLDSGDWDDWKAQFTVVDTEA